MIMYLLSKFTYAYSDAPYNNNVDCIGIHKNDEARNARKLRRLQIQCFTFKFWCKNIFQENSNLYIILLNFQHVGSTIELCSEMKAMLVLVHFKSVYCMQFYNCT